MVTPKPRSRQKQPMPVRRLGLRRFAGSALGLTLAAGSVPAYAADLTAIVRSEKGEPVRDAVVTVDHPANAPMPRPGTYEVRQKDIRFDPFVLVVPVGSVVKFPNHDEVRHHVYSFSPAKRFELKLYGHEEHRSILFDKTGGVALGCNIHDRMSAFIKVVDTVHAAKTDGQGRAVLRGLPAGVATLRVWHPYLRAPGNETLLNVDATATANVQITVRLRRPAPVETDY